MTRAAVTHFDGDPIVLDFWLLLYDKYWRGEVDKVYADVCYDPSLVTPELLEREKASLHRFPEICVDFIPEVHPPEWSNPRLIKQTTEDNILLIESDGWIFGKGVVDKYFKVLEGGDCDLVAGDYRLLSQPVIDATGHSGFMRNFLFIKGDILRNLELDFYPRTHDNADYDCFGFISYQLANRHLRVLDIPCNLMFDGVVDDYINYPWLHIRQMNSSILGWGNAGSGIFAGFRDDNAEKIASVKQDVLDNPTSEWQYRKACAMRLVMVYALRDFSPFGEMYKETIKKTVFALGIDWDKVQGMVTYYRTVMNV